MISNETIKNNVLLLLEKHSEPSLFYIENLILELFKDEFIKIENEILSQLNNSN